MKKNINRDISRFSTLCSQPIHYGFESWSCTSLCHHVISFSKDFIHIAQTVIDKPWVSIILFLSQTIGGVRNTIPSHRPRRAISNRVGTIRNGKFEVFEKYKMAAGCKMAADRKS